jgi:hypothetical protein
MVKRLFAVFLFAGLIGLGSFYFYQADIKVGAAKPLQAIPKNAIVVGKSNDFRGLWKQLSQTNLMWQELLKTPYFLQLDSNGRLLDSLIFSRPELADVFGKAAVWTSLHRMGAKGAEWLYVVPFTADMDELKGLVGDIGLTPAAPRMFEQAQIYTTQLRNYPKSTLHFSVYKEVLLCSFSQVLIEDGILQLNSAESLLDNEGFAQVLSTSGEYVDANLFVHYAAFNKLVQSLLNENERERFEALTHFADWSALDLTFKPNALMFNGFSYVIDSVPSFLSCFSAQKPQDLELLSVVPSDLSNLLCYGVSNYERFFETYRKHLQFIDQLEQHETWVNAQNKAYEFDIERAFADMMGNEFGFCLMEGSRGQAPQKLVFFKAANMNGARAFMEKISALTNEQDANGKTIGKLQQPELTERFFGVAMGGFSSMYYTELEPFIVMGASPEVLLEYTAKQKAGKVLRKDENFAHFMENLSSQSSVFLYSNFSRSRNFYQQQAGEDLNAVLETYAPLLDKFEAAAVQFTAGKKGLFYQNAFVNYNPVVKKETKSLWETELDTAVYLKPYVVMNHYTKANEIVVQDSANHVYLIDNKGNVLWKKLIDGPIISDVVQIDVYRNNKLQLLFNTSEKLYLLDRNGKHVTNYPVTIKDGASTGMTLVDYDKNRDYRILIPTNKRRILNFTGTGEEVDGWKFRKSKGMISRPLRYFALNGKDYLVAVDDEGHVEVLNRRGEERIKVKEQLPIACGDYFLELHQDINNTKLVAIDSVGNVVKLLFGGERENIPLATVEGPLHFEYQDINNDKSYEYLLLNEGKLSVYNQQKQPLFEIRLPENSDIHSFFYFSSLGKYGKIGLLDRLNEKIYLYYDAGGLGAEFPLSGSSVFTINDINNDEVNDVIVGLGNTVVTYSLKR